MLTEWFQSDLIYVILLKSVLQKWKQAWRGIFISTKKNSNIMNYPYVYIPSHTVKRLFLKSFFMENRDIYILTYWLYDF